MYASHNFLFTTYQTEAYKQLELKTKVLPTGYVTVVPTAVKADDKTSPTFLAITCGSLIPCTSGKQFIINYYF